MAITNAAGTSACEYTRCVGYGCLGQLCWPTGAGMAEMSMHADGSQWWRYPPTALPCQIPNAWHLKVMGWRCRWMIVWERVPSRRSCTEPEGAITLNEYFEQPHWTLGPTGGIYSTFTALSRNNPIGPSGAIGGIYLNTTQTSEAVLRLMARP